MKRHKMPKSYYNYFIFIFILSASGLLSSCKNSGSKSEEEKIVARTPVTIIDPVYKDISETIELPAVTTYLIKNVIRSSTTGIIEAINVTPGENVNKGTLLFKLKTLEATAFQDTLANSANLGFKGIINIFSPKDGIISAITHQGGDFVQDGDELAVISDINSLVFILEVPFEMTRYIEKNNFCFLKLPDNTTIKGRIREKLPEMNIQNQTVSYIVEPEIKQLLPQNLIASAGIIKSVKKGALVLPKPAILGNETQTEFWVMRLINDSTAVKIPVIKGIETFDEVEIKDPLFLPTDKILFSGNYGLPDTASVIVNK
jgi:HlyD family secretion protein